MPDEIIVEIPASPDVIVVGESGRIDNATLPATYNAASKTVGVNQDAFTHISSLDYAQFDTTAPSTPAVARLQWNDTDGTLEFQMKGGKVTQQIGMEQVLLVKSSTNNGLTEGRVIYATGSDGTNILAAYANASSEAMSSKTLAVMTESTIGGSKGYATTFGLVRGLNTTGMVEGAAVWLSPAGSGLMTTTKPSAPSHLVFIGYCLRTHQNNGVIFVSISNGYELEELHNVKITNPQEGDTLRLRSGLWVNEQ